MARTLPPLARSPSVSGAGGGSGSWGALHQQLSISPASSNGSLPNVGAWALRGTPVWPALVRHPTVS